MDSSTIRRKFLEFFENKQHQIVPSAPLVVKDDPTLMFTNAGMNQFKDYFLGNRLPSSKRVADTQKCLRVSGKHNDLEEVGIDTYHHTMFEMLGNWSFGDYFKKEVIAWSWELLTSVFELPKERMYVTIFEGDDSEGLERDAEALQHWKEWVPEERILNGSKKDNFWEMGDTGPCGPCSEIHIDLRPQEEIDKVPGADLVNKDHPLVIEVWNLVFIQFNRMADGSLKNLPAKHVDTGMGFERLAMAVQGKTSNYDTDVFMPLIDKVSEMADVRYGEKEETDIAIRVVVDHVRAVSFAISDGQLPSNNGAGYVIRRILRRAVRYGYTYLNFNQPFIHKLVAILANQTKEVFPELKEQEAFVDKVIHEEEQSFLRTLEQGIKIFEEEIGKAAKVDGKNKLPGNIAFKLYDTYGFPIDLTLLLAREKGATVDMKGFENSMQEQKNRSKSAAAQEKGDWIEVRPGSDVAFLGYDTLTAKSKILRYRQLKDKKRTIYQIVLDQTPFYAESGGQVGDTGYLEANGQKVSVIDTQKENELIVHHTKELPQNLEVEFEAVVNVRKRKLTENNHSCTHLLHAALRQVLGDHVQQRGSLVTDKVLRFDFSHFAKMTDEEIAEVERLVNEKIREDIQLNEKRNIPIEEARAMGAMALFGEKYGDYVRVVTFDPNYSVELCGGTHVSATGKIGFFKIISESSVAAGVRRVEAYTADTAEQFINDKMHLLEEVKEVLKNPKDVLKAVQTLLDEKSKMQKQIEQFQLQQVQMTKNSILQERKEVNGINVIVAKASFPSADSLKKLSFEMKNEVEKLFMVLAADIEGKPQISVVIDDQLVKEKDLHAGNLVKDLAKNIQGGGGGQPFFATAGGKDINGLQAVVETANDIVKEKL